MASTPVNSLRGGVNRALHVENGDSKSDVVNHRLMVMNSRLRVIQAPRGGCQAMREEGHPGHSARSAQAKAAIARVSVRVTVMARAAFRTRIELW